MKKNNLIKVLLTVGVLSFATIVQAAPSQKSFFSGSTTLVYGSQDKDSSKDDTVIAFNLKKQMKSFINMTSDSKVNEYSLNRNNLIILAHEKSNSLLNFANMTNAKSNFPLTVTDDSFTFGGKTYTDRKAGVAFIFPSPYNAKNYVLIYYSNSVDGLDNLTKNAKMNYDSEYQVVDEQGKITHEGKFNKDNFNWKFDVNLDKEF